MSNACYAGMRIGRTEETAVGRSNACYAGMRIGRTGRKPCGGTPYMSNACIAGMRIGRTGRKPCGIILQVTERHEELKCGIRKRIPLRAAG